MHGLLNTLPVKGYCNCIPCRSRITEFAPSRVLSSLHPDTGYWSSPSDLGLLNAHSGKGYCQWVPRHPFEGYWIPPSTGTQWEGYWIPPFQSWPRHRFFNPYLVKDYWITTHIWQFFFIPPSPTLLLNSTHSRVIESQQSSVIETPSNKRLLNLPSQGLLNPTSQSLLNALAVKDYLIPTQSGVIESQPSQRIFQSDPVVCLDPVSFECI